MRDSLFAEHIPDCKQVTYPPLEHRVLLGTPLLFKHILHPDSESNLREVMFASVLSLGDNRTVEPPVTAR